MRTNETGLFPALEAALKASRTPGLHHALRLPEIHNTPPRWCFDTSAACGAKDWWPGCRPRSPTGPGLLDVRMEGPKAQAHAAGIPEARSTPRILADRPSVLITEEGSTISIELPNLMIVIKSKP